MKSKRQNIKSSTKGGLIQFRADESLLADLTQVAQRLHLPAGVLARFWVSERLQKELSLDIAAIDAWKEQRYRAIDRIVGYKFDPGPIQILHLVPFQQSQEIEPERVRQYQRLLPPVERVDDFIGSINLEGYQITKQFQTKSKLDGLVQVFRTGQLESIRQIKTDESNCIYVDYLDDDLIRAIWSYSCALEALQVKPPVALFVGFKQIRGCHLKSQRFALPSEEIIDSEFQLHAITIKNWDEVLKIENAAHTVKKILDQFANSAGLARSMSYDASGDWLGPVDQQESHTRRKRMLARTEVIELPGTNRDANRVDLILHDGNEDFIIGKVRAPYLEPTAQTRFKCLVNQDEMSNGAKQRLEHKYKLKLLANFSVGKFRFSGKLTRIVEKMGAGSCDGFNIPQEHVLMFDIEP